MVIVWFSRETSSTTSIRRSDVERTGVVAADLHHDHVLSDGALEHIGRALGHQTTPGDDPDPVGQFVGLLQVLGGEEDGHPQFGVEPADLRPHAVAAGRVQSRGGLVEEEDLGVVHQGGGQIEPALHPAGVRADAPVDGPTDVDQIQNVAESGPDLGRSSARRAGPGGRATPGPF